MLLFDVMDTLVHDPFFREAPAFLGMSMDEILAQKHPTSWAEFELGRIDEAEMFRRFWKDGRAFDHVGLKRRMTDAYRWLDGVEQLLAALHAGGHEMHALSNYSNWYRDIEARLGVSRYVAWSFVSCDLGVRKPDADAWRIPLERLGRPPSEVVFIDDREPNCAAARALGIRSIRFRTADALRAELAALPGIDATLLDP